MDGDRSRARRSRSFGEAAEAYERYRLGYGPEIVESLRGVADGSVRTVVEIGAGTGLATRVLAAAGLSVTAVEPDAAMLAVLRRTCAGVGVTPVQAAYEDLDPDRLGRFDALVSAAAFHWTRPAGRWDRAAALVRPGGAVMILGGPLAPSEPEVAAAEADVVERIAGRPEPPGPVVADGPPWPSDELLADDRFTRVSHRVLPRSYEVSRADWLGHLGTVSAHAVLPDEQRQAIVAELRVVLPERIEVVADLTIHVARRR